jgi:S-adenosylmethionine:tRNA ribosyltransferase-isomerase
MKAAAVPVHRPKGAKLLAADRFGSIRHYSRVDFPKLLRPGDLVIANDAGTMPASLFGHHLPTGSPIEVRLAGRQSLAPDAVARFSAIVFGAGDFRVRTEDRPLPPRLNPGDRMQLGALRGTVVEVLGHPRHVVVQFDGSEAGIWEGLAKDGRPIQYSHVPVPLAHWDAWTPIAGLPVAFEPPSAGFVLGWSVLADLRARGVGFETLTHAAGISSTGDPALDALLPFDEPYRIPRSTALAVRATRARGDRIVAVGTTVVRALEHCAATHGVVTAGDGFANQRITSDSRLRVVDAVLSGAHEPGTSHYQLLGAFTDSETLRRMDDELERADYRTHEFGDSVFLERRDGGAPSQQPAVSLVAVAARIG